MSEQPWMKFYPADWRADPCLKMCSLAARGLWIEMLAIMHEAEPYGQLKIAGVAPSAMQLAMQVGAMPDDVETALAELENAGVFSRTRVKVIYSRRMIKDAKRRVNAKINGSKGGNPSLGKQTIKPKSVNPKTKGEDKAHIYKPDTRYQKDKNKQKDEDLFGPQEEPEAPPPKPELTKAEKQFEIFFSAYPKRTANAKAPAFNRFKQAIKKVEFNKLLAATKAYAKSREGEDPQFTMKANNWLSGENWEGLTGQANGSVRPLSSIRAQIAKEREAAQQLKRMNT